MHAAKEQRAILVDAHRGARARARRLASPRQALPKRALAAAVHVREAAQVEQPPVGERFALRLCHVVRADLGVAAVHEHRVVRGVARHRAGRARRGRGAHGRAADIREP